MDVIGIIAEYNPFHNGHIYHIEKIKEKYPGYMENISFNAVLDEKNDFQCSSNFFTYDFISSAIVGATTLNQNS